MVSARLAAFSDNVMICDTSQEVLDRSDLVFLAVRPQDAQEVLTPLHFTEGQHLCSLIASVTHETLQDWIGTPVRLFRSIPLPSVAQHRGVTILFPHDPVGDMLFRPLGTVVSARTVEEFDALASASAMMGTYFGVLEAASDWMQSSGIGQGDARSYLSGVFAGLAQTAVENPGKSFDVLRSEHSTPAGLNAEVFEVFSEAGGTDALKAGLDSVMQRLTTAREAVVEPET
ncbi:pyrroline-5-carboxylate reductase dimerization domain-containing protein [Ruegeria sp. 6PALISEP08]|uniref:pyrroline-5-carboxylate reductase dimerization domain-containing protein n=1 Tax=Ruegeria sp. 6PALISEP08 TaxID=1225660 RepID=UPI00067ED001|nr:pyrroline-5-carboxylate reductase dimerization domain-containing protein [Ruegeria sp. 6PALISEP08]